MRLEVEFEFSAAHRLPVHEGPCARLHGHNYRLIVTVEGQPDPETGMVMPFEDLERTVRDDVLARCDHQMVNDFLENPTAERIAEWIWDALSPRVPGLFELRLFETPRYAVVYRGG